MDQDAAEPKKLKNNFLRRNKVKVALTILCILLGLGWWLHYRFFRYQLQQAEQRIVTYDQVVSERQKCSGVLSQQTGDFGEYEYCRRLIQRITE